MKLRRCECLFAAVLLNCLCLCKTMAPSNVTLHTSLMTWNEAQRYCRALGQSLVTIESLDKQTAIEFFLNHSPWKDLKSKRFWIGLHAPLSQKPFHFLWEESCLNPSLFRWGPMEPNTTHLHYCVYALLDGGYLKWHTDKCSEARNNFMCEEQLDECTYDVMLQTRGESKISADVTHTDRRECMTQCLTFTSAGGLPCWGFNFNKGDNSCTLLATNDAYRLDTHNSLSLQHDLFVKRCQIKPHLSNITNDDVVEKLCTDRPVGKCSEVDGLCLTPETPSRTDAPCVCRPNFVHSNNTDLERRIENLIKEIKINRKDTSQARRKLISVEDKRPSSKGIGYVAVAFMSIVFGGLVLMDLGVIVEHARKALRRLRNSLT